MDIFDYKPTGKISQKHLLTLKEYSREDIYEVLHLAVKLKEKFKNNEEHKYLAGKTLAMIFSKSSTRTRVSFEMGIKQLGGSSLFLSSNDIQLGRGETIHDTAKVLSSYGIDGVMIRTFKQSDVEELALYGAFPVINGLTDDYHPCQALADYLTIYEKFGRLNNIKLVYSGDGNNVAHSLMLCGTKLGAEVVCACPECCGPSEHVLHEAKKYGKVSVTADLHNALRGAHAVYTDVFFSMGQAVSDGKKNLLMPYQINRAAMSYTDPGAIFLHCLPAHRGEEVTADVIDSPCSYVFLQAENRLHVQKAVMTLLMGNR